MKDLYSLTEHNYVVDAGKIGYFYYVIRSTGNHPCAYVGTTSDIGCGRTIEELDDILPTHGGITYKGDYPIEGLDANLKWIGWDYGHCFDYQAYFEKDLEGYKNDIKNTKKYTYKDIMADIKYIIKYLEAIPFIDSFCETLAAKTKSE